MKYLVKIAYIANQEENQVKKNELYLVEADNFTEAETKATKTVTERVKSWVSIEVVSVVKKKIDTVIQSDGDLNYFFQVQIVSSIVDEKGKEKKTKVASYIIADSITEALKGAIELADTYQGDAVVTEVKETAILEEIA